MNFVFSAEKRPPQAATPAHAASPSDQVALDRRLGPIDGAAIVVSNVIGGGIFFVPILVARQVPSGGEYVYLREAYGRAAAFLTGWTSFIAGFSGAIAAGAVAFADYLGRFVPAAGDRTALFVVPV